MGLRAAGDQTAQGQGPAALRIADLATGGDQEGVQTWQAIAAKVDQLMDYRSGRPLSRQ